MDLGISRHQCEAFTLCLPDQHAVEGIPVDRRETTGHDGVLGADGQLAESAVADAFREVRWPGELAG
jgi:hypothetical protein